MKRSSVIGGLSFVASLFLVAAAAPACSGSNASGSGFGSNGGGNGNGGGGNGGGDNGGGITGGNSGPGLGSGGSGGSDGGTACVSGAQCNVQCNGGATTTITGTVLDPAGKNPLYNVVAYVPSSAVQALPSGVPTGAEACSCNALFSGDPIMVATTDTSGKFTIANAPVGADIPLVIQVGKWRKQTKITTTACTANDAGKITLPKNGSEGDIPHIAVSTGGADQLECLLRRVGLDASEYVPGWSKAGHVHIFNGGDASGGTFGGGRQEKQLMTGAPNSYDSGGLWDSLSDLNKNDIVLLSCEGSETFNGNPQLLEQYLNGGGRVFASHFHYAWFNTAPADWGTNLADWQTNGGTGNATIGGTIVTTLTGGGTFPKGVALKQWLGNVGALGQAGVPTGELAIAQPRYNANVTNQKPSQPWIQGDPSTGADSSFPTLYFSFDTPVNAPAGPDGGAPSYCGRAVFSGLHVGGASYDSVNCSTSGGGGGGMSCPTGHVAIAPPPDGCDTGHDLSPQEKALEFMLFDLSSCVVPDQVPPTPPPPVK